VRKPEQRAERAEQEVERLREAVDLLRRFAALGREEKVRVLSGENAAVPFALLSEAHTLVGRLSQHLQEQERG
jgi:plasmid stabilization system protein ParE